MTLILFKFWGRVFVITLIIIVGVCFLPHDDYFRYKALDIGAYGKAKWIYERIIFDDTPIDIVFIGTSHTLNAIDSEIIEEELSRQFQEKLHVVNLALPHFGRDMHLLLTRFLLKYRTPKLIVLEVRESEARDMHPATHYLANSEDLLKAPIFVNIRYLSNLSQLPLRQINLFLKTK